MLRILEEYSAAFAPEDTETCRKLRAEIKADFIANFRNADGTYAGDEWTASACAVHFGLDDSPALVRHLLEQVRDNGHKADFGML